MSSLALQPLLSNATQNQNQALAALLFLYGQILEVELPWLDTVQELLGHRDVRTTMIYTHVLKRGPAAVRSPADVLVAGPSPRLPIEDIALPGRYPATRRSLTPRRSRDD
jgi:hypothetical protein